MKKKNWKIKTLLILKAETEFFPILSKMYIKRTSLVFFSALFTKIVEELAIVIKNSFVLHQILLGNKLVVCAHSPGVGDFLTWP